MKVGIHSIIKDCYEPYLLEWFNYHHSLGIDYFFIYDNESKVPIQKTISQLKFQSSIYVELFPGKASQNVQRLSYLKFLTDAKNGILPHCDRVAFLDDDEFIIIEDGDIKSILSDYLEFSGLALSWRMFGSSGILKRLPTSRMKKFVYYTPSTYLGNLNIKSIVDPYLVKEPETAHTFHFNQGICVDIDRKPIEGYYINPPIYRRAWINHYWTGTMEDWQARLIRGRSDMDNPTDRDSLAIERIDALCTEHI
jgi:hypothetical protein